MTRFLKDIGVNPDVAAEDACRMEHVISDESFFGDQKLLLECFPCIFASLYES